MDDLRKASEIIKSRLLRAKELSRENTRGLHVVAQRSARIADRLAETAEAVASIRRSLELSDDA